MREMSGQTQSGGGGEDRMYLSGWGRGSSQAPTYQIQFSLVIKATRPWGSLIHSCPGELVIH